MRILAIETSCDETAVAVLEVIGSKTKPIFKLLSNVVLSQIKIHRPYGGVVPNLAKREHKKNLPLVFKKALKEAGIKKPDIVAVTYGPGLEPALWQGVNFAKDLAKKWKVPLIPVNHLEGHIYASWLPTGEITKSEIRNPKFPFLALIVSGGHTELVLMKKHLDYKILGETRDDAAGEAFDKVAKMLGLDYPGGPEISKLAGQWETPTSFLPLRKGEETSPQPLSFVRRGENKKLPLSPCEGERGQGGKGLFPRPMMNSKDLNFSFSGLKTAVLYYLRDNPRANKAEVAYEFQQAVVDVLVKKTADVLQKYKVKSLVVGGGVAANKELRVALSNRIAKSFPSVSLHISPLWLTGDNAAMIAAAAYFKIRVKRFSKLDTIQAQGNLRLI